MEDSSLLVLWCGVYAAVEPCVESLCKTHSPVTSSLPGHLLPRGVLGNPKETCLGNDEGCWFTSSLGTESCEASCRKVDATPEGCAELCGLRMAAGCWVDGTNRVKSQTAAGW